mgnify:CR=1 FL=1
MYYWRIYNFVTEMRFAVRKSTAFVKNKKRKHCKINVSASYMRLLTGIGPVTSALPMRRSTD